MSLRERKSHTAICHIRNIISEICNLSLKHRFHTEMAGGDQFKTSHSFLRISIKHRNIIYAFQKYVNRGIPTNAPDFLCTKTSSSYSAPYSRSDPYSGSYSDSCSDSYCSAYSESSGSRHKSYYTCSRCSDRNY